MSWPGATRCEALSPDTSTRQLWNTSHPHRIRQFSITNPRPVQICGYCSVTYPLADGTKAVSYTHLRAHETEADL
eukprot:1782373-Rhodomonas_salina.1